MTMDYHEQVPAGPPPDGADARSYWIIDVAPWGRRRTTYRCTEREIRRAYAIVERVKDEPAD
jgi:hypothetical protein